MFHRFTFIVKVVAKMWQLVSPHFSQLKISRNSSTFDRRTRTIRFLLAIGRLAAPICRHFCALEEREMQTEKDVSMEGFIATKRANFYFENS